MQLAAHIILLQYESGSADRTVLIPYLLEDRLWMAWRCLLACGFLS